MEEKIYNAGDEVNVALPDGTVESGWKIFMVNAEKGTATITRETGSDIESKVVAIAGLRQSN